MRRRGYVEAAEDAVGAPAIGFYEAQGWKRNGESRYLERYDLDTIGFSKRLA